MVFYYFFKKHFLLKIIFRLLINLTTRGPLYTCLVCCRTAPFFKLFKTAKLFYSELLDGLPSELLDGLSSVLLTLQDGLREWTCSSWTLKGVHWFTCFPWRRRRYIKFQSPVLVFFLRFMAFLLPRKRTYKRKHLTVCKIRIWLLKESHFWPGSVDFLCFKCNFKEIHYISGDFNFPGEILTLAESLYTSLWCLEESQITRSENIVSLNSTVTKNFGSCEIRTVVSEI